jgi:hypothetical protein
MMARCMTRWKPRVGCVSTSSVPADLRCVVFDEVGRVIYANHLCWQNKPAALLLRWGCQARPTAKVFDRDEFMPLLPGLNKGHV